MLKVDVMLVVEARDAARTGRGQEVRERAGLTRPELAMLAEVSPLTLSRWERRETVPTGRPAIRYALALRGLRGQGVT
jgi:transcriptional regulator with XRE-family HTH domain